MSYVIFFFSPKNHTYCSINPAVLTPVPLLFWGSTLSGSRQQPGTLPRSTVPKTHALCEFLQEQHYLWCPDMASWGKAVAFMHHCASVSVFQSDRGLTQTRRHEGMTGIYYLVQHHRYICHSNFSEHRQTSIAFSNNIFFPSKFFKKIWKCAKSKWNLHLKSFYFQHFYYDTNTFMLRSQGIR